MIWTSCVEVVVSILVIDVWTVTALAVTVVVCCRCVSTIPALHSRVQRTVFGGCMQKHAELATALALAYWLKDEVADFHRDE